MENATPSRRRGNTPNKKKAASPKAGAANGGGGGSGGGGARKLSDQEVRSIFECLHDNRPPPAELPFRIVPACQGQSLSPPSFEFPDGLYVLLKPLRKLKKKEKSSGLNAEAPAHLQHLVLEDGYLPADYCKWSLSGPQFPKPTAIQQRYCYPSGRPEYSNHKGASMWTMYSAKGEEDKDFRLLHVYYSSKRASNNDGSSVSSPPKKRQRTTTTNAVKTPKRSRKQLPLQLPRHTPSHYPQSPIITTSPSSSDFYGSPLSFDPTGFPSSTATAAGVATVAAATTASEQTAGSDKKASEGLTWPEPIFVTPINDLLSPPRPEKRASVGPPEDAWLKNASSPGSHSTYHQTQYDPQQHPCPSPFRSKPMQKNQTPINVERSPVFRTGDYSVMAPQNDEDDKDAAGNLSVMDDFCHDIDQHMGWNSQALPLTPSHHQDLYCSSFDDHQQDWKDFGAHLDIVHNSLRASVFEAPETMQPQLVSTLAQWAQKIATDPLAKTSMTTPQNNTKKNDSQDALPPVAGV